MKTSVIRYRVADFLREHPPFDTFSLEDLLQFCGGGRVVFHEDDIYLFRKGEPRQPVLWVIQQGKIELWDETSTGQRLQDVLGPGDLLGLMRISSDAGYSLTARTATEAILYSFDLGAFETQVDKYPEAARFLTAHLSAAARQTKALQAPATRDRLLTDAEKSVWLNAAPPPASLLAQRLSKTSVTSPMENNRPTVPNNLRSADYWLSLIQHRSTSLALTEDGTAHSPLQGILTADDLSLSCGRNPLLLLQATLAASTVAELAYVRQRALALLRESLVGPSVVTWFTQMLSELQRALIERVVELAERELLAADRSRPDASSCWLLFGAAGRHELLAASQVEMGLVYVPHSAGAAQATEHYFVALAESVTEKLAACGWQVSHEVLGPGITCRPLTSWQDFYRAQIHDPIENAIYDTRALFDFQVVCGEQTLGAELQQLLFAEIGNQPAFIPILANDTIASLPPLTFFQGAIIEQDGKQSLTLDLEKTVLIPLSDAARVWALAEQMPATTNTLLRLQEAISLCPHYGSILHDAAEAWRILSYQQTRADLSAVDGAASGQSPRLSKFEQRLLKTAFDATQRFLDLTTARYNPRMPR